MFNWPNVGGAHTPEHLANYYLAQAEYFERLKVSSSNNPILFYQYGEQQFYNLALAHRYKAMTAGGVIPLAASRADATRESHEQVQTERLDRTMVDSLRQGGYILFARHAEATVGDDQPDLNFEDCHTQRNLSENGRRQAVTYGEQLGRLGVPVDFPVISSPFCRTRETAELAFGDRNVQLDPFLFDIYRLSADISESEQQRILNSLHSILETQPTPGTNKVIIAHSFPRGVGLGRIPNMGTIVVRPNGPGNGYEIADKLRLSDLLNLS